MGIVLSSMESPGCLSDRILLFCPPCTDDGLRYPQYCWAGIIHQKGEWRCFRTHTNQPTESPIQPSVIDEFRMKHEPAPRPTIDQHILAPQTIPMDLPSTWSSSPETAPSAPPPGCSSESPLALPAAPESKPVRSGASVLSGEGD
jgi:hypothetical protein